MALEPSMFAEVLKNTFGASAQNEIDNLNFLADFARDPDFTPDHSAETVGPGEVNGDDIVSYLDGLFSSVGSENALNREFNAQQAELNRQWATSMSNTAYQRGMADMKAAGLNPILMFGSGHSAASVPSSSAASYQYGGGDTVSTLLQALGNLATGVSSFLPSISRLLNKANKIGF